MYFFGVLLLTLLLPAASVYVDHAHFHPWTSVPQLVANWFVFWATGVRLVLAGLRQLAQPRFTSERIFGIKGEAPLPFVRELGIANLAIGAVGVLSLWRPDFVLPVALAAAIFYGAAGIHHAVQPHRAFNENVALAGDLFLGALFGLWIALTVAANFGIDIVP